MTKKLFRDDALEAQKSNWIGNVILLRPFSFTVLTGFAAFFAIILLLFLFFGSYTKRSTVMGQLMPNTGLIRVYAKEGGIVTEKFVKEGQTVKKDQPLYAVSLTRFSDSGNYNQSLEQQINIKQGTLDSDKQKSLDLHQNTYSQTESEISALSLEIDKLNMLLEEQKQRLHLAKQNVDRYQELRNKDYISTEDFQLKQDAYLDQKLRLQSYEREKIAKQSELANKRIFLKSLSSKLSTDLSNLDRQIATNRQELIENKAKNSLVIKANGTGVVASINAQIGQQVSQNVPLLNIVPEKSTLYAHLYVPSSAIGFIKKGQPVKLRFQAFPYQKFGQVNGEIISISDTTMNSQELMSMGELSQAGEAQQNDAIYLVKVKLASQDIKVYGESRPFKVGMAFEADILQEKRKLYEWVLEPLYSISGKI
ncbi:HlyD family secretion protein [Acinetobacter shaoyimingii]|uniref:HlyD family efflux transporter periplasmic adaptor subunit n=1 Tax=Acinetobacter shaoyimingii TaxID=2715164 RepID=A0A6G8RXZ0_9GAMM|nr:HlyD family efflux transporter periplasmic adaptor subunit [Acinetobacter shaoyimingii]NHB57702.1 HlyD family efflux transporter periplasmic adaptor subunit [Acinetobacter shaoyimingii]QIO06603.1 HlyD family efflux transporter periplasmic adaptor subunit [Acinetobacter shaoyimingii]